MLKITEKNTVAQNRGASLDVLEQSPARCEEEQQISSPPPMNLPLPLVKNNKKRNPDIMI
jgi:hypothetical protein